MYGEGREGEKVLALMMMMMMITCGVWMSYSMMMRMMTGDDDCDLRSLIITVTQWHGIAYKYVLNDMD